jgi:hypothetical protein
VDGTGYGHEEVPAMRTRRGDAWRTCWLTRFLRGRRLDRNPLRRRSDRAETAVLATLLTAFLAGVPFAAHAAGNWAYATSARQAQAQRASLHQVEATLLQNVVTVAVYGAGAAFAVDARWRAPDGQIRTGEVLAPTGAAAGSTIRVWVDHAGRLTHPPLTRSQLAARAQLAGWVAAGALAIVLVTVGWLTRRALDRRRLAGWDAEWLAFGPRWSPRRLGPSGS